MNSSLSADLQSMQMALPDIRESPRNEGSVKLIVRRPRTGEREVLAEATIDLEQGLLGDKWSKSRSSSREAQITMMNSRAIAAIAGPEHAWPPAGDQLFVDLDLSVANLPSGTRLEVGSALLEVSEAPHLGCKRFAARYGRDAVEFVNSPVGISLRLRGLNAKVIKPGVVRSGDRVSVRRSPQP